MYGAWLCTILVMGHPNEKHVWLRGTFSRFEVPCPKCPAHTRADGLETAGRVAVRPARREPSGSASSAAGTLKREWQCGSHCHSVSIVPNRYAQGPSGSAIDVAGMPKGRVEV